MTARAPKVDDVKIRTIALDAVLRAAGSLKGWDLKSGGELLAEASIVEQWIRTGSKEIPTASRPAAAGSRGKKRKRPK